MTAETSEFMPDRLRAMYDRQLDLQISLMGRHPEDMVQADRLAYVREMVLAATDELHEALNETGWKSWAKSDHIHTEAFQAELVDVFHFFLNLMIVSGMKPNQLYQGFMAKQAKNRKRQAEGYDGVSTKCKVCARALDDDAVHCTMAWCTGVGAKAGWSFLVDHHCPSCGNMYGGDGVLCMPQESHEILADDIPVATRTIPRWCDKIREHVTEKGLVIK